MITEETVAAIDASNDAFVGQLRGVLTAQGAKALADEKLAAAQQAAAQAAEGLATSKQETAQTLAALIENLQALQAELSPPPVTPPLGPLA